MQAETKDAKQGWRRGSSLRVGVVSSLAVGQAIPEAFVTMLMPVILTSLGVPLEQLWPLSLILIPSWFRWLVAPMVDRWQFPVLGLRRSWLIPTTLGVATLYGGLALYEATADRVLTICFLLFIAKLWLTFKDIAGDGYTVESFNDKERPYAASGLTLATFIGTLVLASGMTILYDQQGWAVTMVAIGALVLIFTAPALILPERPAPQERLDAVARGEGASFIRLLKRPETPAVMSIISLRGFIDNLAPVMTAVFLAERGYSLTEIGAILGAALVVASIAGNVLSALLLDKVREPRAILYATILAAISLTPLIWISTSDQSFNTVVIVGAVFMAVFANMPLTTFVFNSRMKWASKSQAGTEFGMQSAFRSMGNSAGLAVVGGSVAFLGWTAFFVVCSLISAAFGAYYIWATAFVDRRIAAQKASETQA